MVGYIQTLNYTEQGEMAVTILPWSDVPKEHYKKVSDFFYFKTEDEYEEIFPGWTTMTNDEQTQALTQWAERESISASSCCIAV